MDDPRNHSKMAACEGIKTKDPPGNGSFDVQIGCDLVRSNVNVAMLADTRDGSVVPRIIRHTVQHGGGSHARNRNYATHAATLVRRGRQLVAKSSGRNTGG
jgi:hypothetical protein